MTLEQAKQASDILNKIYRNRDIINNLKSYRSHHIAFGRGNYEDNLVINDNEFINTIVDHSLHILTEEIWELEQDLKLL